MRVIVCGARDWTNYSAILRVLTGYHKSVGIDVVIEGECRGADKLAKKAANELGIPVMEFPANWRIHGKAAGVIRNNEMLTQAEPDLVIAFHEDITKSRGTKDMLQRAMKAKISCRIISS